MAFEKNFKDRKPLFSLGGMIATAQIPRTCGRQPGTTGRYRNRIVERMYVACFHDPKVATAC